MKNTMKGGLTITSLIVVMMAIATAGGCAFSAFMTQNEKIKYSPDSTPEPRMPAWSGSKSNHVIFAWMRENKLCTAARMEQVIGDPLRTTAAATRR